MTRLLPVLAASALAVIVALSAAAAPPPLRLVDLGALSNTDSLAVGINNSGTVVGYTEGRGSDAYHAFLWTRKGGMVGLTPGHRSQAYAINDRGQVLGRLFTGNGYRPFVWQSGHLTTLPTLPGGENSEPVAINESGQVVGDSDRHGYGNRHAFFWTRKGGMVDLGTLDGRDCCSSADGINDRGQVIGNSGHGFLWTQKDGMVDLGTLGGKVSFPSDINNNGQVVGWSPVVGYSPSHAFSWTAKGGMVDLGTLGGSDSYAQAVNDRGQIVGEAEARDGHLHAVVWTPEGSMIDLGTHADDSYANSINNDGQVVGVSTWRYEPSYYFGYDLAFSWTAAGGMVDLGTLGGRESHAGTVNDNGQIIGWSDVTPGNNTPEHAFVTMRARRPQPLD